MNTLKFCLSTVATLLLLAALALPGYAQGLDLTLDWHLRESSGPAAAQVTEVDATGHVYVADYSEPINQWNTDCFLVKYNAAESIPFIKQ